MPNIPPIIELVDAYWKGCEKNGVPVSGKESCVNEDGLKAVAELVRSYPLGKTDSSIYDPFKIPIIL